MGKLDEFLQNDFIAEEKTQEVEIKGFPYPFKIKSITEGENKAIRNTCKKVTFDKKTHQKDTEVDSDLYNNRLIIACCVEPNFKDAETQKRQGVVGAEKLLDKILDPGQYTDLLLAVQSILGFTDDINDLTEEAKNSSPVEETTL